MTEMTTSAQDLLGQIVTPEFWQAQLDKISEIATAVCLNLIFALIVLLIGWIIIKIILWVLTKILTKSNTDPVIINFVVSVLKFFLWMILIMMILDIIKIQLVSMAAIVAALAFAVGLALGDFMRNLVAGVVILGYKHFKVGEVITGGGVTGMVKEIGMTRTILCTQDNRTCIVPNEPLAMGIVENLSRHKHRGMDLRIGVSYDADLKLARKTMQDVCKKHPLVLNDPPTVVAVHELAGSSVNFTVRPMCKSADYWTVMFEVTEQIKLALDKKGVGIPFPQLDVHLIKADDDAGERATAVESSDDADADDDLEGEATDGDDDEDEYEYEYETEDGDGDEESSYETETQ